MPKVSNLDAHTTVSLSVDDVIARCMSPLEPKSFFLYAGAGSGKTRSLVHILNTIRTQYARHLDLSGKKVGVITYTNAARDEIERRMGLDPLFQISTIHSFCWSLIQSFHSDIREWLKIRLQQDLAELKEKQAKGRAGSQAAQDRERDICSKTDKLNRLDQTMVFTYSPNGDNFGKNSLSHSEVLQIASTLLQTKPLMQLVLINRYPLLMIDESQDTNANLIEALFKVEQQHTGKFALGLFGDMMQRVYSDGKHDLGISLPSNWEKPEKLINYRSAKRIVHLGNALRSHVDTHIQTPLENKPEGFVKLFIANVTSDNKPQLEQSIREKMTVLTSDNDWSDDEKIITLMLEHHMAAARLGFLDMWQSLYPVSHLKRGLIDGDLPGVRLFSGRVLPIYLAAKKGDRFAIAENLKEYSPLLARSNLASQSDQHKLLQKAKIATDELTHLISTTPDIKFRQVLLCVAKHNLFEIPESLIPFIKHDDPHSSNDEEVAENDILSAWRTFLESPFLQIIPYTHYISKADISGTHQGVKGLEFKRVMVILDDHEARGFLYSYEKLFGVDALSDTDKRNELEGRDNAIARTLRLLYVTCTRAEESLAILVYSKKPNQVRDYAIQQKWFDAQEIELL